MDRDANNLPSPLAPNPPTEKRARLSPVAIAFGVLLCIAAVSAVAWWLNNGPSPTDAQDKLQPPASLFVGWPKPDVALLLSGESHGYLQPCGCSHPQKGGLARRYAFLQTMKKKGWPVVGVDLGDIPQRGSPQSMLKYETAMKALRIMDYTAVTFGEQEMSMVLVDVLAQYALNNSSPVVVATNLKDQGTGQLYNGMVKTWAISGAKDKTPRVGVVALTAPSVQDKNTDPKVKFDVDTPAVLRKALGELHAKQVDLVVLLYQGTIKEATMAANFCAKERTKNAKFPRVNVILCLDVADEPAGQSQKAGDAMIVSVGHKGRYVGVVGAYRTNQQTQPWELRYQLVPIGEEFEAKEGQEKFNPVIGLMQEYADAVKSDNYLAKYPRQKHLVQTQLKDAEYLGDPKNNCKSCHATAFKIWEKSPHPHAYESLVKAKRPSNRQFDGECVVCHTVGFNYDTGFNSAQAIKNGALLTGVSCENCHGPCSDHAADPKNKKIHALINPHKFDAKAPPAAEKARLNQINASCVKCHDIDNDVHWNFEKNWPKIVHHGK